MFENIIAIGKGFTARPRLTGAFALGGLLYWLLPAMFDAPTRLLVAWNIAVVAYLVLTGIVMVSSDDATMRRRARLTDEGRSTVLILAVGSAVTSLAAIVFELLAIKSQPVAQAAPYLALAIATILTAWTFVHIIFTEHYAHEYYSPADEFGVEGGAGGKGPRLKFPHEAQPDYLDFLYFAFTIAVANQTADVSIPSRTMRALVLIHAVISYFFNTIILALTINIAAGLLAR